MLNRVYLGRVGEGVRLLVPPYRVLLPAAFQELAADLKELIRPRVAFVVQDLVVKAEVAGKPTIDILLVTESTGEFLKRLPRIEALSYDYRAGNTFVGSAAHLFFRKVRDGRRTHHLHVLAAGSPEIDDYRLFREIPYIADGF